MAFCRSLRGGVGFVFITLHWPYFVIVFSRRQCFDFGADDTTLFFAHKPLVELMNPQSLFRIPTPTILMVECFCDPLGFCVRAEAFFLGRLFMFSYLIALHMADALQNRHSLQPRLLIPSRCCSHGTFPQQPEKL